MWILSEDFLLQDPSHGFFYSRGWPKPLYSGCGCESEREKNVLKEPQVRDEFPMSADFIVSLALEYDLITEEDKRKR